MPLSQRRVSAVCKTQKVDSDNDTAQDASDVDSDASFEPTREIRKPTTRSKSLKRKRNPTKVNDENTIKISNNTVNYNLPPPHSIKIHQISSSTAQSIQKALLSWYATVHTNRGMPWRKPFDSTLTKAQRSQRAYEVWISEIMLQQTQVVTVIPYYNRWMEKCVLFCQYYFGIVIFTYIVTCHC